MIDVNSRVVVAALLDPALYRGVGVVREIGYDASRRGKPHLYRVEWPSTVGMSGPAAGFTVHPPEEIRLADENDEAAWRHAQGLMSGKNPQPVEMAANAANQLGLDAGAEVASSPVAVEKLLQGFKGIMGMASEPAPLPKMFRDIALAMMLHASHEDSGEYSKARVDAVIDLAEYAARAITKKEQELSLQESMGSQEEEPE